MNDAIPVIKDEENQTSVPTEWRKTMFDIIESFKKGDYGLADCIAGVNPISEKVSERIEKNIKNYGATLISLPEETWDSSACQWMWEYWDVLIDLYTVEEGASDLALSVRVYENEQTYTFDIQSVYVP
jgi:hypothetical protein